MLFFPFLVLSCVRSLQMTMKAFPISLVVVVAILGSMTVGADKAEDGQDQTDKPGEGGRERIGENYELRGSLTSYSEQLLVDWRRMSQCCFFLAFSRLSPFSHPLRRRRPPPFALRRAQ